MRIKRRRYLLWGILALCLALSIILTALYAGSRTVAELDYGFGACTWRLVNGLPI